MKFIVDSANIAALRNAANQIARETVSRTSPRAIPIAAEISITTEMKISA
jgi:hypothetical protein